jgi:uncharacterized RDD family membrane protein YckC
VTVIDVRPAEAAQPAQPAQPAKPEPYDHRFGDVPGYLLARLAAFGVDMVAVPFIAATFLYHATDFGPFNFANRDAGTLGWLVLLSLGGALAFRFLCEGAFGTSLGKLVFALHVRSTKGGHAGFGRALWRSLVLPVDVLLIGPLLAAITPRHQRAGDLLGGTVVGGSPLRLLAPLIGLVLIILLGYAQVTFGGGLTSAVGVAAEVDAFGPALVTGAQQRVAPHATVPSPAGTP